MGEVWLCEKTLGPWGRKDCREKSGKGVGCPEMRGSHVWLSGWWQPTWDSFFMVRQMQR